MKCNFRHSFICSYCQLHELKQSVASTMIFSPGCVMCLWLNMLNVTWKLTMSWLKGDALSTCFQFRGYPCHQTDSYCLIPVCEALKLHIKFLWRDKKLPVRKRSMAVEEKVDLLQLWWKWIQGSSQYKKDKYYKQPVTNHFVFNIGAGVTLSFPMNLLTACLLFGWMSLLLILSSWNGHFWTVIACFLFNI